MWAKSGIEIWERVGVKTVERLIIGEWIRKLLREWEGVWGSVVKVKVAEEIL